MQITSTAPPFGAYLGYIIAAVAVLILVLLVIGFRQGREINFWPPRVGPRDRNDESGNGTSSEVLKRATRGRAISDHASTMFEVHDAKKFYQLIAVNYDERNTANLLTTHFETIERIERARADKAGTWVLDLGGGTGQNIATHFFNDEHIHWDYVDSCPDMAGQLRKKLFGRRLHKNLNVHIADINNLHELDLREDGYDVIVLSFVLSSMRSFPNFGTIFKLLVPGGSLIISDANPDYTYIYPLYEVNASNGHLVAMRMNPVKLLDLVKRTSSAGFGLSELVPIGDTEPSYSFIATFERPFSGDV